MGIMLLWAIWVVVYFFSGKNIDHSQMTMDDSKKPQKTYEHVLPEQVIKSDFFAGEFMRNDVASIYPRRQSLVKDILVDIWDEVYAGQTLAILFEPWVEGQSASNIWLKSIIVSSQSKILSDTKNVAEAKIAEFDQKIREKEVLLQETLENYDEKITQVANNYDTRKESLRLSLEREEQNLITLQTSLKNAVITKDQKLQESIDNINQKLSLLDAKIDEVYTQVLPLIYIWEESEINYENTKKWDLSQFFSVQDSGNLNSLVFDIQKFQTGRYTLNTLEKYEILRNITKYAIIWLENTLYSVGDTDEITVVGHIEKAKLYDTNLLNQKEIYDDALSSYDVLQASEDASIENIEQRISEQEIKISQFESSNTLFETDNSVELTKSEKDLQIEKLTAELETLRKSKVLLVASENKQITQASNGLAIAQADLNKEYIASGDFKIISPFNGTISKRNIEIGEMISPSIEAYRVSGVNNSLSRIAKKEIKFFVPESLQWKFEIGQEVYFSSSNEAQTFSGAIYRISPEVDEQTRSIIVQAKVDESVALSNKSTIRVSLETESLMYRIPTSSIYNKWERTIMYYKKDNGKLWVKDIVILSDDGEFSIVTGDFDTSLKVVTTPIFVK